MKVLARNDTMEFLELDITDSQGGRSKFMTHNTLLLDQRAYWTMHLLQAWGMAGTMGDMASQLENKPNTIIQRVPPEELVMRVCEVVNAAWDEMQRRGWLVNTGSIGEK